MAENKDINAFAREYLSLFTDQKTQEQALRQRFGEQSHALGFIMDGGRGFVEQYSGEAYDSTPDLQKVLDDVSDPMLLGSAIYSRWRYVTNWSGQSLLDEANRSWFVAALGRLAELTQPHRMQSSRLRGQPVKVQLISNNRSSGRRPTLNEQIEQRLTVRDDGRISLSVADYEGDGRGHKIIRSYPDVQVALPEAELLLDQIGGTFAYAYSGEKRDLELAAEPGLWKLILTDEGGRTYTTAGPLGSRFPLAGIDLSDRIRQATGNYELLAFDGNPDLVTRLEVYYRSGYRNHADGTISWIYAEKLAFDRRTESAEHVIENAPGLRVRHSYYLQDGVSTFLDTFDERSFQGIQGNPPDIVEQPDEEIRGYEVGIYTRKGKNRVIRGTYDKRALPRDWEEFVEKVLTFLSFYGFGQFFDAERYATTRRRSTDHTYLSVVFADGSERYYLAEDGADYRVDDFVVVPAGRENEPVLAQITSIIYGNAEEAPRPYQKLKRVIRKGTQEDFREFQDTIA